MKILLLLCLIPVGVSFLVRKWLADRVFRNEGADEIPHTGRELVERLLQRAKINDLTIEIKKRTFTQLSPTHLVLSPKIADSKRAVDVAEACLLAGLVMVARQQDKVVAWRTWAVKFGWVLPAFTSVIMFFAVVVGRVGITWAIAILALTLGITTILLWLTLPIERLAAQKVAELLEDSTALPRRTEGERLARLVKASVWRRIIPSAIAWIGGKN